MALDALTSTLAAVSHEQWCDCFGAVGALTFPLLFSVNPAYGKTFRRSWGRPLSGRWGWFVQEIIAPVTLLWSYYSARATNESLLTPQPVHVFLFLFTLHYANRAVLYPLQRHMSPTALVVVLSSILFNLVNGHLIGVELATRTAAQLSNWRDLAGARVVGGLALMALGAWVNVSSDARLRALRARMPGDRGYYIPTGGLFELVCCPHYFGEGLEWTGFAFASSTRSGCVFAFWTFANLIPRAWNTRKFYREKFKEFPLNRRCMLPYVL
jgi:hypothetical protein